MMILAHRIFGLLISLWACSSPTLWAGDGHDHGEAPAAATGPALPRFSSASDDFELVGVLGGHQLKLYLDHAPDNRPVVGASLELQANGQTLPVSSVGDGEFIADWENAPESGEIAFSALIVAGTQSDLLAAELDLHQDEHEDEAAGKSALYAFIPWLIAGLGGLIGLAGVLYGLSRASTSVRRELQP